MKSLDGATTIWEKTIPDTWPRVFAVSPKGDMLAAFLFPRNPPKGATRIAVFSATDGQERLSFKLDQGTVRSLAFSRDGSLLISGMDGSDSLVWDISAARKTAQNQQPR
jgi:WD40 repeat protein